jgi:hypothetical protein
MNKAVRKITELLANTNFFQIKVFADLEIDGKIYKDKEQRNNDSILNPKNWEQHKETFFTQRMVTYSESYTLAEKIKLEVSRLEKLPMDITDYEILKDRYKSYLEQKQALPTQQKETKTDRLKVELGKYGFFELPMVKQLSEPSKQDLIELISTNDLPYIIAMVEYLGFLKHLKAEHFSTDNKLFKAVAKCLEGAERAVRGNIYVLSEISRENRTRYTAHQQRQKVQKDYEELK